MRAALAALSALGALAAASPAAASPGTEQLEQLRATYRSKYLQLAAPALERYQADLLRMETTAVARRDYATAEAVRNERGRVAEMLAQSAALTPPSDPAPPEAPHERPGIALSPAAATLGGGVALDTDDGTLTGWVKPGAYAEWTLPEGLETGGYEVEITYAADAENPRGTLVIREPFYTLTRRPPGTGGADHFVTRNLGILRIKEGSPAIRIIAEEITEAPLFTLKELRLIPASHPTPTDR